MNIEAVLLTAVIFAVFLGCALTVARNMTWAVKAESNIFRAIRKRDDPTGYRSDHDDE